LYGGAGLTVCPAGLLHYTVDMETTRLDRIEALLEQTAKLGLENEQAIARVAAMLSQVVSMHERHQALLAGLTESISRYTDSADARMKRLEENLDGLIRAITAEHTNRHSKK
jgi:hypothetical protein